jgi:hypothetical protein
VPARELARALRPSPSHREHTAVREISTQMDVTLRNSVTKSPSAPGVLGTGLSAAALAAIAAITVVVFLFWDGALWRSETTAAHTARIAVSYLIAIPLIWLALVHVRGGCTWTRFGSALGLVWAVKLIITSSIFVLVAPGTARHYEPVRPWEVRHLRKTTEDS